MPEPDWLWLNLRMENAPCDNRENQIDLPLNCFARLR